MLQDIYRGNEGEREPKQHILIRSNRMNNTLHQTHKKNMKTTELRTPLIEA